MQATMPPDEFYATLTLEQLKAMSTAEFDALLIRLFELAGYQVQLQDIDLYLGIGGNLASVASISHGTMVKVGPGVIQKLQVGCRNFSAQKQRSVTGIMISRAGFIDEVLACKYQDPDVTLLDGDQLLRYYRFLLDYRMDGYKFPVLTPTLMTSVDSVRGIYSAGPNVLAISNNRGGIGKSTTAVNIAYGLAEKGLSVLAIDLDPQANFTEMLGGRIKELQHAHVGRYFVGGTALPTIVQQTPFSGIKLIAAHPEMGKALIHPAQWLQSHFEFAQQLRSSDIAHHPLAGPRGFDWVIIDTPPDVGFYSQAAITAANFLLAPTFPSDAGNQGIEILIQSAKVRSRLTGMPRHARFLGFVATRYADGKASSGLKDDFANLEDRLSKLVGRAAFADASRPTFLPSIPETPKVVSMTRELVKATQNGQSIKIFEKEGIGRNEAGAAYKQLVEEVLTRASIS